MGSELENYLFILNWTLCVHLPLKWPSGMLKDLTKELPVGDQPVGRINQLSEHTIPGLGHPFVTGVL